MAPPAVCLQGKCTTVPEVCHCQFPTDLFLKNFYSFCLITPVTKSESLQRYRTQTTTESVPHSRTLLCSSVMCTFRGHHLLCQWLPRPAARKVVDPNGARWDHFTSLLPLWCHSCLDFFSLIVNFFVRWISQEDDIIMSLDVAIELARNMKQTTDKMAKRLSADLWDSHPRRTPPNMQPLEGSKRGPL